jgi:hypothetical protein
MRIRHLFPVIAAVLVAACAADPILIDSDEVPDLSSATVRSTDGNTFRLQPNQVAASADGGLFVTFRGVTNDNRCPTGVVCIWAGNAEASVGLAAAGQQWNFTVLNTGIDPKSVTLNGYTVTLVDIEPAARQGGIAAADYVAILRITRA